VGQVSCFSGSAEDCGQLRDCFPAVPEAAEISQKQMASKGVDVSAFVEEGKAAGGTFFLPISEHSSDVVRILRANFDSIF